MSPPQVNICVKPSPLVSKEEMLWEKKDKTDVDSISVETKGKGKCCKVNRRCRIICCVAVIALIAGTVAVVLVVKFGRRHHEADYWVPPFQCGNEYLYDDYEEKNCTSWSCLYGKDRIIENVWIEEDLQLIHAEHDHGSSINDEPSMHVLHDYQNHMAAYKDKDRNVCYITVLEETFEDGLDRWHSYETYGRQPKTLLLLSHNRTEPEEVQHIAGVHIYAHCKDAQSFWAEDIEEMYVTASMTIVKV